MDGLVAWDLEAQNVMFARSHRIRCLEVKLEIPSIAQVNEPTE